MTDPIDFKNIRSITEGDKELEHAIFQQFIESFEETLVKLENACAENNNDIWRKNTHALKGTCLNVGAMELGGLCKHAQENHLQAGPEKRAMLDGIKAEYARVRTFLLAQT